MNTENDLIIINKYNTNIKNVITLSLTLKNYGLKKELAIL